MTHDANLTAILAVGVLLAVSPAVFGQGVDTDTADLPPDGVYVSPVQFHEYSAAGVVLDDPSHRPLVGTTVRTPVGSDEIETFDSEFRATEIGVGAGPITLVGPTQVVTRGRNLATTGTFDTEIVSMSLSGTVPGLGPIMVREDVNRASVGKTDILDLGGGLYHIDSFFDVFTELSVDGGQSWIPSDYATRMTLVPEPASMALLLLGGLGLLHRRARRACGRRDGLAACAARRGETSRRCAPPRRRPHG